MHISSDENWPHIIPAPRNAETLSHPVSQIFLQMHIGSSGAMSSIGNTSSSLLSTPAELTVAAANLNFGLSLVKGEATKGLQSVGAMSILSE